MSDSGSPITLIYKELFERYEELKDVTSGLAVSPRIAVVGQLDAAPEQLAAALFGAAEGQCQVGEDDAGGWHVAATFKLEDVPGRGVVGSAEPQEQGLAYLREADVVLLTVLADRRPTETEQGLYDHLKRLKKVRAVVVASPLPVARPAEPRTPPELDADAWAAWIEELRRVFDEKSLKALPLRYLCSDDVEALALYIHDHDEFPSRYRLSFVALLEHQRSKEALVARMIGSLSSAAAWIGLSPIPFSDVAAITPVQVLLVCRVAAAYGHRLTPTQAKEFIAAVGGVAAAGMGWRALFRRLTSGLGEALLPVKLAVGAGVAWSGTQVLGLAAREYYRRAGHLTPREAGLRAKAELARERGLRRPWGD